MEANSETNVKKKNLTKPQNLNFFFVYLLHQLTIFWAEDVYLLYIFYRAENDLLLQEIVLIKELVTQRTYFLAQMGSCSF